MSGADELARRLETILESEEGLYVEMRVLLQKERGHMLARDVVELERSVRCKEILADECRLLEESRSAVVSQMASDLGLASERATLSHICAALGEGSGDRLQAIHSRLVAIVGAVRELLHANEGLAGECLARVQGTLRLLGCLMPERPTYGPGGAVEEAPRAGRLLSHAV